MNNQLVSEIEKVITTIEPLYHASYRGEEQGVGLSRDEFERISKLAEEVYCLAANIDLDRHLPQVEKLRADFSNAPSNVQFQTMLNLPGWWDGPFFVLYPTFRWLDSLRMVAQIATGSGKQPATNKRGRKGNPEEDKEICNEYNNGLENREWSGQVDYLQKKHLKRWTKSKNNAKSWLSQLLGRVRQRAE